MWNDHFAVSAIEAAHSNKDRKRELTLRAAYEAADAGDDTERQAAAAASFDHLAVRICVVDWASALGISGVRLLHEPAQVFAAARFSVGAPAGSSVMFGSPSLSEATGACQALS